ncbi:hypothetical protein HDV62DRAFT_168862 [Trichoderma sp. SZMC 28011]
MHLNRYRVPLTQPRNRPQPTTPLKPAFEWAAGQLLARSCAVASARRASMPKLWGSYRAAVVGPPSPFNVRSPLIHDPISLRLGLLFGGVVEATYRHGTWHNMQDAQPLEPKYPVQSWPCTPFTSMLPRPVFAIHATAGASRKGMAGSDQSRLAREGD